MCQDCRTAKDTVRGVAQELLADLLLPFVLYAVPIGLLVVAGVLELG